MKQGTTVVGSESFEKKEGQKFQASSSKNKRKKPSDVGAESRKRTLLCQRAAAQSQYVQETSNEDMKSFLSGLFQSSFQTLTDNIDVRLNKFECEVVRRLDKLEGEVLGIRKMIPTSAVPIQTNRETDSPSLVDHNSGVCKT